MNGKNSSILTLLAVNFILSFFGIYGFRDEFVSDYMNYWDCCRLLGGMFWLILFVIGAIYVLAAYFLSDNSIHISACVFPIVEVIGLFVMKGAFNKACVLVYDATGGFSLWGWIMIITAAVLLLDIIGSQQGNAHPANETENTVSAESPKNSPVNLEKK